MTHYPNTSRARLAEVMSDATLSRHQQAYVLGISVDAMRYRAKALSIDAKRPSGAHAKPTDGFRDMWEAGVPVEEICRRLGICASTARRMRTALGLARRHRSGRKA